MWQQVWACVAVVTWKCYFAFSSIPVQWQSCWNLSVFAKVVMRWIWHGPLYSVVCVFVQMYLDSLVVECLSLWSAAVVYCIQCMLCCHCFDYTVLVYWLSSFWLLVAPYSGPQVTCFIQNLSVHFHSTLTPTPLPLHSRVSTTPGIPGNLLEFYWCYWNI